MDTLLRKYARFCIQIGHRRESFPSPVDPTRPVDGKVNEQADSPCTPNLIDSHQLNNTTPVNSNQLVSDELGP
ncbi:hypothetical protein Goari_010309, partial [Gossypium aridum]|nr:hypothetical protein [Gossypium aridum]